MMKWLRKLLGLDPLPPREDFFREIRGEGSIAVSQADDGKCLLQTSEDATGEGPYTCVYLDDEQVRRLIVALSNYLFMPNLQGQYPDDDRQDEGREMAEQFRADRMDD